MEWIVSRVFHSNYIADERLADKQTPILITYETNTGKRHVRQVECTYGFIKKKAGGEIIAWAFLPEPYKGRRKLWNN
jgi:hypothetical protein